MRDRFYAIHQEADSNRRDDESDEGSDGGSSPRNCRDVGAPGLDGSDDDVDDPVDAAGRGTRGTRPPRESFIPDDCIDGISEEATIRQALERLAAGREDASEDEEGRPRVHHPRQLGTLPEQKTPYLASKCFPWLFTDGRADLFFGAQPRDISFADHAKHLMCYADVNDDDTFDYRFASDRLFRYWCSEMKMRLQARQQCSIYLRQNPETAQMTLEEVLESVRQNVRSIIGRMTRYSANVSGSDGYWLSKQERLENAVEQLPSLAVFTTHSAADHHWFDVYLLMPSFRDDSPPDIQQRNRASMENSHLADWWFSGRLRPWKKVFLGPQIAAQLRYWDRTEWQSRASLHVHGCSAWGCEPGRCMTSLSRTFLEDFLARRHNEDGTESNQRDGGGCSGGDGGVSDAEYERVQREMCAFLAGVGFAARNPTPPAEGVPLSDEARQQ